MMTREEYLLRYEDQLLEVLKEHVASVNHTMLLVATISTIDLLVAHDLAHLLPFFGIRVQASDLCMIQLALSTWAPGLIGLAIVYSSYSIYMIRKALSRFNYNADCLRAENEVARPISRSSIRLRRAGAMGLWLYTARKLVEFFAKRGTKTRAVWRMPVAMGGLVFTLFYLTLMFALPVGVALHCSFLKASGSALALGLAAFLLASAFLQLAVVIQLIVRDALASVEQLYREGKAVSPKFVKALLWVSGLSPKDEEEELPPKTTAPDQAAVDYEPF